MCAAHEELRAHVPWPTLTALCLAATPSVLLTPQCHPPVQGFAVCRGGSELLIPRGWLAGLSVREQVERELIAVQVLAKAADQL